MLLDESLGIGHNEENEALQQLDGCSCLPDQSCFRMLFLQSHELPSWSKFIMIPLAKGDIRATSDSREASCSAKQVISVSTSTVNTTLCFPTWFEPCRVYAKKFCERFAASAGYIMDKFDFDFPRPTPVS